MKCVINKIDNAPEFGVWGRWCCGGDCGTFGRNSKGMWAQLDGTLFIGLETYEEAITEKFLNSIIKWRKLNHHIKKYKTNK